ncbi:MAG: hypothetical protein K1X57_21220 [Gemmataceae bacterium]|nr:hypothetical protein [Gemmataceae bacterium]
MKKIFGVAAVVALTAGAAVAGNQSSNVSDPVYGGRAVLPLDGSWTVLDEIIPVGGFFSGPWTYSSAVGVSLDVTDLYVVGDEFAVYLDGGFVGTTSDLPDWSFYTGDPFNGANFESDVNVAWSRPEFSKGTFLLPAGTHDVTFQAIAIASGFADSTIAFRAHEVPAPASLGLVGIAGLVAGRRRR